MLEKSKADGVFVNAQLKVPDYLDGTAGRRFRDLFVAQKPRVVDFLSARLTLGGLDQLRTLMPEPKHLRILLPPTGDVVPEEPERNQIYKILSVTPAELILTNQLSQRQHAKLVQVWLRQATIEVRTLESSTALTWMAILDEQCVVVGNPEISMEGLSGEETMIEAGLTTLQAEACSGLRSVYDRWWALGADIKGQLIERMDVYWKPNAPQFIYYLSLWHLFHDQLEEYRKALKDDRRVLDTPIWKKLFAFQRHGAIAALNMLDHEGGCILADSVGLGKTYTALAVIKAYERMGKRILVLCPKKLKTNWSRFLMPGSYNPFRKPNGKPDFDYYLVSHTDLVPNRKIDVGAAEKISSDEFFAESFGLVVIDESHNFRNKGGRRYKFLLDRLLQTHPETKLLLLSATPVNNRLTELTHQLALIAHVSLDDLTSTPAGFKADVVNILRSTQKIINAWNKEHAQDTATLNARTLLEVLPPSYFKLLQRFTIARSRDGIMRYYVNAAQEIGAFPKCEMVSCNPLIDTQRELDNIEALSEKLYDLTLAAYNPMSRLAVGVKVKVDDQHQNLSDEMRQRSLVALTRMNALKRLESSVQSFCKTVKESLLERTQAQLRQLANHKVLVPNITAEALEVDDAEESDELRNTKAISADLFDCNALREDLEADEKILTALLDSASKITPERDGKLLDLMKVLREKHAKPFNAGNVKAIIFTTFEDTAAYLFAQLIAAFPERTIAMTSGQVQSVWHNGTKSTLPMGEILARFAPKAQERPLPAKDPWEIDWVVSTDCLSEGQNLQDCDFLINWDIHWNPLRLIQRAGRIDRIGSPNALIKVVHFWPTEALDDYINLERRVRSKDALVAVTGGGGSALDDATAIDLKYRLQQLKAIKQKGTDTGSLTDAGGDFGFRDYLADLDAWLNETRQLECETAPFGLCAVPPRASCDFAKSIGVTLPESGVIFLLRRNDLSEEERNANALKDHFLFIADAKNNVKTQVSDPLTQAQALHIFRDLCRDEAEPDEALAARFERSEPKRLNTALANAFLQLDSTCNMNRLQMLLSGVPFDFHSGRSATKEALTLLTFAVIDGGAQ